MEYGLFKRACFEEETAFSVIFSRILRRSGFASRFDEKLLFFHLISEKGVIFSLL